MHPMVRVASNEESGEISTRTLTKDRFLLDEVNSSIQIGFPIALAILERARIDLHESFKCGNFTQRRIVLSSSLLGFGLQCTCEELAAVLTQTRNPAPRPVGFFPVSEI